MFIRTFRCFGTTELSGNYATVIEGQNKFLSVEQRLQFTKDNNFHACVFVDTNDGSELLLDFYYPHARSLLCLHATLACAYVCFEHNPLKSEIKFILPSKQIITAHQTEGKISLAIHATSYPDIKISEDEIRKQLKLDSLTEILNTFVDSVGSPKLFIEIDSVESLYKLRPDLVAINAWSVANKMSGIYAFVRTSYNNIVGRNFNHIDYHFEDCATGVAAGALTNYLQMDLIVDQGANLNNPCKILTTYGDRIGLAGQIFETF